MSKRANPALIGGFVIAGVVLAVAAIAFLASGLLFTSYQSYVSYFPESVNGLSVGAPVKFRGIQLGRVSRIGLYSDEEISYAEVEFRLEMQRMIRLGGTGEELTEGNIRRLVTEGLRSRLEVESIVTGVVFVTLEIKEDAGPPVFVNPEARVLEIPTGLSPMSELTESAGQVIARLSNIDVNGISDNILQLTETLNEKLEEVEVDTLSDNLEESSRKLLELVSSPELENLLDGLNTNVTEFRTTQRMIQDLLGSAQPAAARLDSIASSLERAAQSLAETTVRTQEMLRHDAEFRRSLEEALSETAQTMKSLRRLTDMLERNPRAMIAGKPEDRK